MTRSKRPPLKQALSISSLLNDMLSQSGTGEQIHRHQIWLLWDRIVGQQISARARPLRLRKGTLEVQVDHPVWMQQLQMMKSQLLEKIAEKLPAAGITDIYLRQSGNIAPSPEKTPPAPTPAAWREISLCPAELAKIDSVVKQISDPELRQKIRHLYLLQLQVHKHRS